MNLVAHIKSHVDIYELITGYSTGKPQRAARNRFVVKCPLHSDSTASLSIYTASQVFRCYGCGAKGDCISFVRKMNGCTFKEACSTLIQEYSISPPERIYRNEMRSRIRLLESSGDLAGAKEEVRKLEGKN